MRFARTALGLLLTSAGLVLTAAGAVAAFWLVGPDNTISTPSRELAGKGLAVITAPDLLDRHGPTLHVSATGDKPLFVGVGQDLDVRDYLSGVAHTRVIRFDPPSTYATQEMRGRATKLTPPGELDWWVAKSGAGQQSVVWPIADGRYDVVVMNADGSPAVGAQVTFGIQIRRAFGVCLLVLGTGVLILALGITLAFRRRPTVSPAPAGTRIPVLANPTTVARLAAAAANQKPMGRAARSTTSERTEARPGVAKPAAVVSPYARARVSPYAPERVSPFAPTPAVPVAPLFMTAAAVAKAKSPGRLGSSTTRTHAPAPQADQPSPEPPRSAEQAGRAEPAEPNGQAEQAGRAGQAERAQQAGPADEIPAIGEEVAPDTVPLAASPEFERSDEAVRKTAALLASGALLLTTTSCGLLPAKNTAVAVVDTRPAVTLADAHAVIQRYNVLNNRANQSRDAKLAETIEANPALAQTRAGYVIGRKLDTTGRAKGKPFTFTDPKIGAPEFASYPMRFVVDSGVSGSPDARQLGVWQRQNAGSPWLLTNSVYPSKAMKIPPLDGLRNPVKADLTKLTIAPDAVGQSLASYLTGGVESPQARQFLPSPGTTKLLELRAKSKATDTAETYIASVTDSFQSAGDPLTFITSDGEALVFVALTEQYLQRVEPGSNAYWTSGEATAFSSGVKYTQTLHQDYLHQIALVIPTKAAGGPVRILSMDGQLVGAGGS